MKITKRYSRKRQKKMVSSVDRLSELPDDILCQILSFLPTRDSVATSILARRWRFLWTYVPNLDFVCQDLCIWIDKEMGFSEIFDKVMLQYKVQNMYAFYFSLPCVPYYCSYYELDTCINFATAHNVQKIDLRLDLDFEFVFVLPQCLFTCKTLVDLRLDACGFMPMNMIDTAVCLTGLKRLQLSHVQYRTEESLPYLLSCCPVLEELIIERSVGWPDLARFHISSATIQRLVLNFAFVEHLRDYDIPLVINTPALKYLEVRNCISDDMSAGALTSLTEAYIHLKHPYNVDYMWEMEESTLNISDPLFEIGIIYSFYCRSALEFVGRLCNVKCLTLSCLDVKVPESTFSNWTTRFYNLTKLELCTIDLRILSIFLENADNLQVLCISKDSKDLKYWVEPQQVPTCLSAHLTTTTICNFTCAEHELELVRYLLRNARVLEKMEIRNKLFDNGSREKFEAFKKRISVFERASEAYELAFC